jgi:carbonic anhydrase
MRITRVFGLQASLAFVGFMVAAVPALASGHSSHSSPPHWGYEGKHGPSHWASLDSTYKTCTVGKRQSPIDIRGAKPTDLPPITFAYQPSPLKVIDNGHTVQVTYAPGSFITVGDQQYELQQFHFHHPAEEKVGGRSFPLVAHLVHKSTDGKLAVVGVLLTGGKANDVVDKVWKHLPPEQGKEVAPEGVSVDATELLPADRGYFTFAGSLTTPPCTEGVTWFVLKTPAEVSADEIATFAKKYPHNARPVQPRNGRTVEMTR